MASELQRMESLPPYTVLLWQEFETNPHLMYNLFRPTVRPGGRTYEAVDSVMDMTDARHSLGLSEIKVNSVEDLHRISNDLLNMPILFHTKVEHKRTDHYVAVRINRKWKDEFAVLVNTRHPMIREPLSYQLTKAMAYMQEGKNFCLKLSFGPSVRSWYSDQVDAKSDGCDSRSNSDSGHMMIYVTNYSTPLECCVEPLSILVCFPFWLICGGPFYCVHRKTKVEDFSHRFTDLEVVRLTPVPFQVTITRVYNPEGEGQNLVHGQVPTHTGYPQPPGSVVPTSTPNLPGYGYDQHSRPPPYPGMPNNAI